jgi:hypothetical protein
LNLRAEAKAMMLTTRGELKKFLMEGVSIKSKKIAELALTVFFIKLLSMR